jgi:phage-related protein
MNWSIVYFRRASGRSPIEEFIEHLNLDEQVDVLVGIDMLRSHGTSLGRPWVAPLAEGIWELRIRRKRQIRILYFLQTGGVFVLLHALVKKTRNVPQSEIQIAVRRMKEYLAGVSNG